MGDFIVNGLKKPWATPATPNPSDNAIYVGFPPWDASQGPEPAGYPAGELQYQLLPGAGFRISSLTDDFHYTVDFFQGNFRDIVSMVPPGLDGYTYWGDITGTVSNQTDFVTWLRAKWSEVTNPFNNL